MVASGALAYVLYNKSLDKRVYVKSTVDNKEYLVKRTSNNSANKLAALNIKKNKLMNYLNSKAKYKRHDGIVRLLHNRDVVIEETSERYKDEVAYSLNKGERIGICTKNKDSNTMFFVLLHELAHIMTKAYKHDDEFWDNFRLLIKAAIESGTYIYQDYARNPVKFCNSEITHNPYKK